MKSALIRVGAVAGKEFKHLLRDPRILATVLVLPVLQLLLFAYAISFDVKNVPTVVLDQDNTPASRQYLQTYRSSEFFDVLGSADDLAQIDQLFDQNKVRIAVIVPSGFARSLDSGEKAQVAVLSDGSEPTSAQLAQAYATALNASYGQQVAVEWADRQGLNLARAIEPRLRTWYNPEGKSSNFLIPGLMVVIIMIVTVQQTAVTLVREREQGTGEQMTVSPLRRGELMVGKLLPWTLLAFADMLAIALVGIWVFGLPLRGDIGFLAASVVLCVRCAGSRLDHFGGRTESGDCEHQRAVDRVPARLLALGSRSRWTRSRPRCSGSATHFLAATWAISAASSSRAPASPSCGRSWRRWPGTRWWCCWRPRCCTAGGRDESAPHPADHLEGVPSAAARPAAAAVDLHHADRAIDLLRVRGLGRRAQSRDRCS